MSIRRAYSRLTTTCSGRAYAAASREMRKGKELVPPVSTNKTHHDAKVDGEASQSRTAQLLIYTGATSVVCIEVAIVYIERYDHWNATIERYHISPY